MTDPNDGARERDPFVTFMWHVPIAVTLALAFAVLPGPQPMAVAVIGWLGWMAGSSVVRGPR